MQPIDALITVFDSPAPAPDELRALAVRCATAGDPGIAELATGLAAMIEADPYTGERP